MLFSATKCPYDETECEQRQREYQEWKSALRYAAENKLDKVFLTGGEARCPKSNPEECIRYKRYMNIVKRLKKEDNQK